MSIKVFMCVETLGVVMTLGLFNSFFDFVVSKKLVILKGGGGQFCPI
jgi:hypothetical protein